MNISKSRLLLAAAAMALVLSGCATSTSEFRVDTSRCSARENPAATKTVYVRNIIDKREFDPNTKDPSLPSLDNPSPVEKDHAIGRKRNSFGQALGKLVLVPEQTVSGITREVVEKALTDNGYRVVTSESAVRDDTLVVDVTINRYWSWFNPGFFAITLSAQMEADVTVHRKDAAEKKVEIKGNYNEGFQTGVDGNWLKVIQTSYEYFCQDAKKLLGGDL